MKLIGMNIYAGFNKDTVVKQQIEITKEMFMTTKCLECGGTGTFDCGIPEEKGQCIRCKGTGIEYLGTL